MGDVLVVEDDRVVLAALARLCRAEGLQVADSDSVDAALAILAEISFRLAVVDLMLPGRSGRELLQVMRTEHPETPVIIVSGYATPDNAVESLRAGAFDFLPKPFDIEELLGVVRRGLRYGERRRLAASAAVAAAPRYFLGQHSWATLDAEGTATVGAGESFQGVLGDVVRVELPAAGDHATRGARVARLTGAEEVHRIWSPLSGRVVAINSGLAGDAAAIDRAPFDSGWLVRLLPADLTGELPALTLRPAAGAAGAGGG
jgi:CheY-like chemotaxis protein